jgi:hypothetical protein
MVNNIAPKSIADLPVQTAVNPSTKAQSRARYFNTGNAFNVQLPAVPNMVFTDEPNKALLASTETCLIPCDVSDQMQCGFPATSPLILAYYARICSNEELETEFISSGSI